MVKVRFPVLAVVVVLGLGAVAGCGDDTDDVEKANQAYCASVEQVRSEVATFQEMAAGDATRDQLSVQADSVRASGINVYLDAKDLKQVVGQELQAAGTQFRDALEGLDDEGVSVEQAKAEAVTAAQAYLDEVEATASEVGCPAS